MTGPIQQTTSLKIKIIKSKWKKQFLQMRFLIAVKILCEYFMIFSQNIATLSLKVHRARTKSFFIIKTEESKRTTGTLDAASHDKYGNTVAIPKP
jgi:hypothetical protein